MKNLTGLFFTLIFLFLFNFLNMKPSSEVVPGQIFDGLKSAILSIFQKLADWLDWPCAALLVQPSKRLTGFFFSFIF
jgi:hypothetical protein